MCYTINSSQIIAEKWENNLLIYIYDEAGSPIDLIGGENEKNIFVKYDIVDGNTTVKLRSRSLSL